VLAHGYPTGQPNTFERVVYLAMPGFPVARISNIKCEIYGTTAATIGEKSESVQRNFIVPEHVRKYTIYMLRNPRENIKSIAGTCVKQTA
jgi:hypothetical protein